jgi:hypothetical protein
MKNPFRKPSIVLAALLAVAMTPSTQFALCVGDGGHRALELLSADCCPPEAEHPHAHDELEDGDDCAQHCVDMPLSSVDAAGVSSSTGGSGSDVQLSSGYVALLSPGGLASPIADAGFGRDGPPDDIASPSSFVERSNVLRL